MKKGFTLIELLVVIAIIGILSEIVLVSLNSARSKGVDSAIKSGMHNARAQAEVYYNDNGNTYIGVCGDTATAGGVLPLGSMLNDLHAKSQSPNDVNRSLSTAGTFDTVTCHESTDAWALEAPLKASASGASDMWCVDNLGNAKEETTNLGADALACS